MLQAEDLIAQLLIATISLQEHRLKALKWLMEVFATFSR